MNRTIILTVLLLAGGCTSRAVLTDASGNVVNCSYRYAVVGPFTAIATAVKDDAQAKCVRDAEARGFQRAVSNAGEGALMGSGLDSAADLKK